MPPCFFASINRFTVTRWYFIFNFINYFLNAFLFFFLVFFEVQSNDYCEVHNIFLMQNKIKHVKKGVCYLDIKILILTTVNTNMSMIIDLKFL